jgi:sugar phosphate isomerase/epimerase
VSPPPVHVRIPFERIGEHMDLIRSRALDLEVYLEAGVMDSLSRSDVLDLGKALDYGPSITIHGPFMDLSPGAADERVRELTVERLGRAIELCEALGPSVFVFHSGYEKWRFGHRVDLWLEASLRTWPGLLRRASRMGAAIAVENIFEDEPENLRLLMGELGSEAFGICFDTGHFNLFSKRPLSEWLDALGRHIIELHLHDNLGAEDSHMAVGEGSFDFGELFSRLRAIGREPVRTVECNSAEDTLRSIERLRAL